MPSTETDKSAARGCRKQWANPGQLQAHHMHSCDTQDPYWGGFGSAIKNLGFLFPFIITMMYANHLPIRVDGNMWGWACEGQQAPPGLLAPPCWVQHPSSSQRSTLAAASATKVWLKRSPTDWYSLQTDLKPKKDLTDLRKKGTLNTKKFYQKLFSVKQAIPQTTKPSLWSRRGMWKLLEELDLH